MQKFNLSVLFLAPNITLITVIVAIAALAVGAFVALIVYKSFALKKVGTAQEQARKIVDNAETEAERIRTHGKEDYRIRSWNHG